MVIVWSRRAKRDMDAIDEYLTPRSPKSARRTIARIKERVRVLELFPRIAQLSEDTGLRELVVSRTSYIVIYRVEQDVVSIVTIVHAKQAHRS